MEAVTLYGKAFPYFNDLVVVFAKERVHGSARGDIGDNAEQYLHENITLDSNTDLFQMQVMSFVYLCKNLLRLHRL